MVKISKGHKCPAGIGHRKVKEPAWAKNAIFFGRNKGGECFQ